MRFRIYPLVLLATLVYVTPATAATITPAQDGAWCWFADPRAISSNGHTYVGAVTSTGDIEITDFDHATKARVTAVLHRSLNIDDHAAPALQIRPDGRLVVYYSGHIGSAMFYRVSVRSGDVTAWHPEQTVPTNTPGIMGYTYANPAHLSAERRTYLFWRGGSLSPTYSTLADGGGTWANAKTLINGHGGRPYVKYDTDGNGTIHFAFTNGHPKEADDVNIYYAAYRNGSIYRADGTRIGPIGTAIEPKDADVVFDGSEKAWVWDVAIDAGRPVVVFAAFPTPDDQRYYYSRWTGTRWDTHEITAAGGTISEDPTEPLYSGGLTIDHDNPSRVYLSRQVTDGWQVETWDTSDGGASWTSTPLTTSGKNVRPLSPRGVEADGDLGVLWMRGPYHAFEDYKTEIVGPTGDELGSPVEATATPASGQAPVSVRFAAATIDPVADTTAAWTWDFGDATSGTGQQPVHAYRSAGHYFVKATTTGTLGEPVSFVTEVTVTSPPPPASTVTPTPVAPPAATPTTAARKPKTRIVMARWRHRRVVVRVRCHGVGTCMGRLVVRARGHHVAAGVFGVRAGHARWVRVLLTRYGRVLRHRSKFPRLTVRVKAHAV